MIKFTVHGKPQGKGRPRVTSHGTYTPEKTKQYEELVRWCWRADSGKSICGVPLSVHITAYFMPPKSVSKKKHDELIGTPYTHKPDADNIAKAILDALNGVAFVDDSAVTELIVTKLYGERDCVEVRIEE